MIDLKSNPLELFLYDFDHFVKVVNEIMGIDDQALLRSLFDACDRDHSGSISASELSTLLFTFHRGDTDENRVRMIFDCVDLDASGFITFEEAKIMIRGLLSMREVLLEHGGGKTFAFFDIRMLISTINNNNNTQQQHRYQHDGFHGCHCQCVWFVSTECGRKGDRSRKTEKDSTSRSSTEIRKVSKQQRRDLDRNSRLRGWKTLS